METFVRLSDLIARVDVVVLVVVAAVLAVRGGLNFLDRHNLFETSSYSWTSFLVAPAVAVGVKVIGIPALVTLAGALAVKENVRPASVEVEGAARRQVEETARHASIDPRHEDFRGPIWNMWMEQARPSTDVPAFEPTMLQPDQEYSLVVNLAALRFSEEQRATVYSSEAGSVFSKWLDRNRDAATADLTVVAVVDADYFQVTGTYAKRLRVDLTKIRGAQRNGFYMAGSPFEYLRRYGLDVSFNFGLQSFRIKTLARTGKASIAISVWSEGKPVDELKLTLCIGATPDATCEGKLAASDPRAGLDLSMKGIYPDWALHLIDQGESGVSGVLRCNSCGWRDDDYRTWALMETADWVSNRLNEITMRVGDLQQSLTPAQVRKAMVSAGQDIYNVIFHVRKQDNEATRAFADFMVKARALKKDNKPPPSLFMRIIPERLDLMLAPVGLMHAGSPDSEFVGLVANVQTPLEYQEYAPLADCISRWVLFVPPENLLPTVPPALQAVLDARQPFNDWIAAFKQSCGTCVIDNEDDFHQWLNQSGEGESNAVVILSHHSANALFFNEMEGSPRVLSSAVTREFATPSFVVLGACGTSEPGSSEFIRQFNFRGVSSAIATSTKVEPVLAGKFLATFMNLLQLHANDSSYSVSQARFDAVAALAQDPNYGAKALAFILAGNGALRLCVPDRK